MIKHRWRELAKSFGNHVDPEKTEQLKRTKTEIENNVTRIFKLIKNEDQGKKDGNRKDSKQESELLGLIENFYQQYQSLYALYDHLVGESGRIVRSKKDRRGFAMSPSSSDSEYYSSEDIEGNNAKFENEHQKMEDSIKHELKTDLEVADVKQKSVFTNEEKEVINSEYMAALRKIRQAEVIDEDLKNEVDERVRELSALVEAHEAHGNHSTARVKELEGQLSGFKLELESLCSKKRDLEAWKEGKAAETKQLREKNIGLHARVLELELVLKDREDTISDLQKKQKENEDSSTSKISDLKSQASNMQLELDSLRAQKGELEKKMVSKKDESLAQAKGLNDQVNGLQKELKSIRQQKTESEAQVDRKNKEISKHLLQIENLKEELTRKDTVESKMMEERECFLVKVKDLESEANSLRNNKKNFEKQKTESEVQLERKNKEISKHLLQIENLKEELTRKDTVENKMMEERECFLVKVKDLESEANSLRNKKKNVEKQKTESEVQLERKNKEISKHLLQIENLKEELTKKDIVEKKITEEKECFLVKVKDLESEVNSLRNKKKNLEKQIKSRNHENNKLRHENEGMLSRLFGLEKTMTDRGDEIYALRQKCEDGKNEASTQFMALMTQVSDLKHELDSLQTQKSQLDLQVEIESKQYLERLTEMENQNSQLKGHIGRIERENKKYQEILTERENQNNNLTVKVFDQQRILKEQEDTIKKFNKEHKQAKIWFPESKLNVQFAERKMEELADKYRINLEDNVRLLYQRIRVAEQIHIENKESYKKLKERYEIETTELKEKLAIYQNPVRKMNEISGTAQHTLNGLDLLALKFEEGHTKSLDQISRMSNELQSAKTWITGAVNEIKQLKNNVDSLVKQLNEKEEQESLLREKVGKLEESASKEAEEKLNLMKSLSQLENQVENLERKMKDKAEDLLSLGEEKREAIRQLCVLIDHHRNRYEDLKEVVSKRSAARSRTGT